MSKPVLGLIGAIGAGKSAAAKHLASRGGALIDADRIGHEVLDDPTIRERVQARWPSVARPDGCLDRRAIAAIVFADATQRRALEEIVYPEITRRCHALIAKAQTEPNVRFIILDAAVMLEAGWTLADKLLYIDAPRPLRLARVAARGWSDADLTQREAAQWPAEVKKQRAHAVIDNAGTLPELHDALDRQMTEWGWT